MQIRRPFRAVSYSLLVLAILIAQPVSAIDSATCNKLQVALESAVEGYNLPGSSAAVRSPDGSVWYGAAGYSNLVLGDIMYPNYRGGIGSITKTFTSTVTLQLVDDGLLSLNDTIEDVLPGQMSVGNRVTVEQLLNMTSGLQHYEANDSPFTKIMEGDPHHVWSLEEVVTYSDGLIFTPGDHFDYCNGNYFILGLMIERLTGMSWNQAVQERILNPLGMTDTGFLTTYNRPAGPSASPYSWQDGQVTDATYAFSSTLAGPSGAMYSSTRDLLTWMDAFMDGTLLSAQTQAIRMEPKVDIGGGTYFGLGIGFRSHGGIGFAGNFNDVFSAEWETVDGWDFAILTNGQAGEPQGPSGHLTSATGVYLEFLRTLHLSGY